LRQSLDQEFQNSWSRFYSLESVMSIVGNVSVADPIQQVANRPIQRSIPSDATDPIAPTTVADRLDISPTSSLPPTLQGSSADKVAAIRAQIESGTYEDDNKLNVTVDKLLTELNK
jgi:Anti-sigma-28 factor, FlgM